MRSYSFSLVKWDHIVQNNIQRFKKEHTNYREGYLVLRILFGPVFAFVL